MFGKCRISSGFFPLKTFLNIKKDTIKHKIKLASHLGSKFVLTTNCYLKVLICHVMSQMISLRKLINV